MGVNKQYKDGYSTKCKACHNEYYHAKFIHKDYPIKKCEVCGKKFKPHSSVGKFCSRRCALVHHKPKRKKATCNNCGIEFTTNKKHYTVCSDTCKKEKGIIYKRLYRELNIKKIRIQGRRQSQRNRNNRNEYLRNSRENLSDWYVADQISQQTGINSKLVPKALIELKREHIKLKRLINEKQRAVNNH